MKLKINYGIVVGIIVIFVIVLFGSILTINEYEIDMQCYKDMQIKELDFYDYVLSTKLDYRYNSVDENHYNCCSYKTTLEDNKYTREKVCKGFIK